MKAVKIVQTVYNASLPPSVMLFLRKLFSWWNIAKYPAYSYFQQLSNPLSFLEPCITQYLWQSCKEKKVSINENIILSLQYLSVHFISCLFVLQNQFVFKMLLYMFSMFRYLLKMFPLLKYTQLYLFSALGIFELSKCF